MIFPGWIIARAIPYELLAGVLLGKYKITGGVIRWAAGTAHAGQIIRHLLPATMPGTIPSLGGSSIPGIDIINTYQLFQISRKVTSLTQVTQQILNIATGTAVLSGLNLLVSSVGFIAINQKLNTIDERLKAIQRDVQAIRIFLESGERARLYAALRELSNLEDMKEHRDPILRTAKNNLLEIHLKYKELFGKVDTPEAAIAYEEYFSLTALALAYCTAELGLLKLARKGHGSKNEVLG